MTGFNLRILGRVGVLASAGLLMLSGQSALAQAGGEQITFAKHVAPILQEKCQVCHQPNSVAPMSLLTYDDALPYAQLMKAKVMAIRSQ